MTSIGDLGWFERMAQRAKSREDERERARRRVDEEFEAADGGPLQGEGLRLREDDEHHGHRIHSSGAHLGASVCSCGHSVGCYSFVIEEGWDPPDHCEVCRARGIERTP